jgi:hypothetical protein
MGAVRHQRVPVAKAARTRRGDAALSPRPRVLCALRSGLRQVTVTYPGVSPVPLSLRWVGRRDLRCGQSRGWMRVDGAVVPASARQLLRRSYGFVPAPMCYRGGGAGVVSQSWRSVNLLISMITKTFLLYAV